LLNKLRTKTKLKSRENICNPNTHYAAKTTTKNVESDKNYKKTSRILRRAHRHNFTTSGQHEHRVWKHFLREFTNLEYEVEMAVVANGENDRVNGEQRNQDQSCRP
jgi:hypothetical protein